MAPKKEEAPKSSTAARFGRVRNNLKMGIVGLPNVGKSSLFNLLCEQVRPPPGTGFSIEPGISRISTRIAYLMLCCLEVARVCVTAVGFGGFDRFAAQWRQLSAMRSAARPTLRHCV